MTLTPHERRTMHKTLAHPPKPDEAPDLARLRALLADHRHPWWLDLNPDGDELGPDGSYTVGGILAPSTPAEIEGGADELHEVGTLHPTAAEALAVAAVNAAPYLLDRSAAAETSAAAIAAVRRLCDEHQAPAEGGGRCDIEMIPPSRILDALATAGLTCGSTFVVPGDPAERVRRCGGRPGHVTAGVMHGGDGAVWGDGAGADQHPGETTVIRLGHYRKLIGFQQAMMDQAADVMRQLIARHRPEPARSDPTVELCAGCGKVWPCPDGAILGVDQATPEELAAAMAGLPRPAAAAAPPADAGLVDACGGAS